jgi:hypothetical protein
VLTSSMLLRSLYLSLAVPLIFFSGHLEADRPPRLRLSSLLADQRKVPSPDSRD